MFMRCDSPPHLRYMACEVARFESSAHHPNPESFCGRLSAPVPQMFERVHTNRVLLCAVLSTAHRYEYVHLLEILQQSVAG
jgi:hypothetical protein